MFICLYTRGGGENRVVRHSKSWRKEERKLNVKKKKIGVSKHAYLCRACFIFINIVKTPLLGSHGCICVRVFACVFMSVYLCVCVYVHVCVSLC